MQRIGSAILAFVALPLFAADVYRSVDENGNVVYSDRPAGANPVRITIATREPATSPAGPAVEPRSPAGAVGRREVTSDTPPEQERAEPTAEERAERCADARDRVERYNVAHRLYRETPDGEREYLNDAEIDEARARAAASVESWCG